MEVNVYLTFHNVRHNGKRDHRLLLQLYSLWTRGAVIEYPCLFFYFEVTILNSYYHEHALICDLEMFFALQFVLAF